MTRAVVDTAPPQITATLSRASLWPPNHQMVDVKAAVTASDLCGPASIVLASLVSNEPDDSTDKGDGATLNDIQEASPGQADFEFLLRAERAALGNGRIYTVTYTANDASGHGSSATSSVTVPLSRSGVVDPVNLAVRQTGAGTRIDWTVVPGALFYNAIRGRLANLRVRAQTIDLGDVVCLESRSLDTDTQHFEDVEEPDAGAGFFYLVEYDDGLPSTYGEESAQLPRAVRSGDCP